MDLAYLAQLPEAEFVERRHRVLEQMQDNSAFIIFTETEKRRNKRSGRHWKNHDSS